VGSVPRWRRWVSASAALTYHAVVSVVRLEQRALNLDYSGYQCDLGTVEAAPDAAVLRWLDLQSPATLYVTTISQAELLAGVAALPAGKRRTELRKIIDKELVSLFADRILPFGERSAQAYAQVVNTANGAGNP